MPMTDAQLQELGRKVAYGMSEVQRILLQATNDINANFVPVVMDIQNAQGTTPPVEPPVEPPTTTPPPTGTTVINAPQTVFGAKGSASIRWYSGSNNTPYFPVPVFTGRMVLVAPFLTPSDMRNEAVIGFTHTADGSHTRQYMIADRPDAYTPESPGVLWSNLSDAISKRVAIGLPNSGLLTLNLSTVYYVIVNNAPPGYPSSPAPFNVVTTWAPGR